MNTPIENVPIGSITVGKRLRKDLGDIEVLAESIQTHGLLHPLTVDDDLTLIAGERRLRAMKLLGFEEVPIRRWQALGADDRRLIELEENVRRKDLTPAEQSRKRMEQVDIAAKVISVDSAEITGPGRPTKKEAPLSQIAELIGIPEATIRAAENHVAAVDTYPFMEDWRQYHALEAKEALDKLPEEERPEFAALIDQPGIPPRDAIRTLQNVATKPQPERKKIIELAKSDDDRERSLALTEAAAMPAMPDPRLTFCFQAVQEFKRAIKHYPNDPEVPEFKDLIERTNRVADAIRERSKHAQVAVN